MKSKTLVKMAVMFSFFIFISTFDTSINKAFGQCDETPEVKEKIVKDIYEKLNGNKSLQPQVSHLNVVVVVNLGVKITGWVDTQSNYDKIREYVLSTKCANKFNENELHIGEPPANMMPGGGSSGCSSGTKPCGDICIPANDVCNIKG